MHLIIGFVLIMAMTNAAVAQSSRTGDLHAAMGSSQEKVRARAAMMLGAVAGSDTMALLESTARSDPSVLVRLACVEAILSRRSARSLPGLYHVGALDTAEQVRALVATRVPAMVDVKSLPFIKRALEETDPRVRALVMRTLPVPMPPSFHSIVARGLGDYPEVRSAAFQRAMLLSDAVRWKLFERLVESTEFNIVEGLADELGRFDDHRVIVLLLRIFDRGEDSPELRPVARAALTQAKRYLPERDLMREAQKSDESHVRMRALKLLEIVGGDDVVGVALELLGDSELPVRATAAMVLAKLGHQPAVSRLETMALDPVNQRIVGHLERALTILRTGAIESEERR